MSAWDGSRRLKSADIGGTSHLGQPTLWTSITFSLGEGWTADVLTRSKLAPLTVSDNSNDWGGVDLTTRESELLMANMYRVKSLDLAFSITVSGIPFIEQLTVVPASVLKRLSISMSEAVPLPNNFMHRHAPNLLRLPLSGITTFPSSTLAVKNLVSLTIRKLDSFGNVWDPAPCDEVLNFLDQTPLLRNLHLDSCFPRHTHGYIHQPKRVTQLRSLTSLQFEGMSSDCLGLLQHLEFPGGAAIDIDLQYEDVLYMDAYQALANSRQAPLPCSQLDICIFLHTFWAAEVLVNACGPQTPADKEMHDVVLRFDWVSMEDEEDMEGRRAPTSLHLNWCRAPTTCCCTSAGHLALSTWQSSYVGILLQTKLRMYCLPSALGYPCSIACVVCAASLPPEALESCYVRRWYWAQNPPTGGSFQRYRISTWSMSTSVTQSAKTTETLNLSTSLFPDG